MKKRKEQGVLTFWGIRGTLPFPGKKTARYGGNTNCVTLELPGNHFFIFDAGTGIKELSTHLLKKKKSILKATLFISHPHYDHINGIPFFMPFYQKGNRFTVYGPNHKNKSIKKLIAGQMDGIYFPVTTKEFSAEIKYKSITAKKTFYVDDVCVSTIALNHPGHCLGYRVQYNGKTFCYITDNELYLKSSPRYQKRVVNELIQFIKNADVVVMDATYNKEYSKKVGWGHSCIDRVVDVADQANVKLLCLYHHDLEQVDQDIDQKLKRARTLLKARRSKVHCIAPAEGDSIKF